MDPQIHPLSHHLNGTCIDLQLLCFRTLFPKDRKDLLEELLDHAGIEPEQRSYQFTVEEINRLCHAYQDICNRLPYIYHYDYRDKRSVQDYEQIRAVEKELMPESNEQGDMVDFVAEELRSAESRT